MKNDVQYTNHFPCAQTLHVIYGYIHAHTHDALRYLVPLLLCVLVFAPRALSEIESLATLPVAIAVFCFVDLFYIHTCMYLAWWTKEKRLRSAIQILLTLYLHLSNSYARSFVRSFVRVYSFSFPAKNRTIRARSQRRMVPTAQATADATTVPLTKSSNIISDTPNGETAKQFNVGDYDSEHLVRHTENNRESSASPICCYNSIAKLKNNRNNSVHERVSSQWDAYGVQNRKSKNGVAAVDRCECRRICLPCVCCCCCECQSSKSVATETVASHLVPSKLKTDKSIVPSNGTNSNNNNNSFYKNKNCENGGQQVNGVPSSQSPPPPTSLSFDRLYVCDRGNCDSSIGANRRHPENSEQNLQKLICCSTHVRIADKQTTKLFTIGPPSSPVQRTTLCHKLCDTKSSFEACCDCRKVFAREPTAIEYNQLQNSASSTIVSTSQRTSFFKCRYVDTTASRRLTSPESNVHSGKNSAPVKSVNINANDFDESILQTQHRQQQQHQQHIDSDNQNNRIIQNGDTIATRRLNLAPRSSATKQQIDLLRSHFKDVAITSSEKATPTLTSSPINVRVNLPSSSPPPQTQISLPAIVTTKYNWKSDQTIPVKNDRDGSSPRNTDHKYERPLTENNVSNNRHSTICILTANENTLMTNTKNNFNLVGASMLSSVWWFIACLFSFLSACSRVPNSSSSTI